jgi:DNA-binding MltR family transcriptional regulator
VAPQPEIILDERALRAAADALYSHQIAAAKKEIKELGDDKEDLEKFFHRLLKESDIGLFVLAFARVDDLLLRAFKLNMASLNIKLSDRLFGPVGPLSTASQRMLVAHGLGWIDDNAFEDFERLRKIRNKMAHSTAVLSVDSDDIVRLIDRMTPREKAPIEEYNKVAEQKIPRDRDRRELFIVRFSFLYLSVLLGLQFSPVAKSFMISPRDLSKSYFDEVGAGEKNHFSNLFRIGLQIALDPLDFVPGKKIENSAASSD